MACLPQSWMSEEEVNSWLSKYDWDKSGDISFAEFAALVSSLQPQPLASMPAAYQVPGLPYCIYQPQALSC